MTNDLPVYLSLGAGVQSSTLALMAARGECDVMPRAAVFADTGHESRVTYEWLTWLEAQLPFPVHRVSYRDLRADSLRVTRSRITGRLYMPTLVPVFVKTPTGAKGTMPRQCTRDYKVKPIVRLLRQLVAREVGMTPGQISRANHPLVEQWMGISRDERRRCTVSPRRWVENSWPLIERGMSRNNCLEWLTRNGYPEPPRSACVFCPYHSDREWQRLKDHDPESFAAAVAYERDMQAASLKSQTMRGVIYLHASLEPLDQVDFAPDTGQGNLFAAECEGMCGN